MSMTRASGVSPSATTTLPLFIVTGFLGAGKTTLLNALLRDPSMLATAVIVNEFGEIGLDHLLFEAVEGDLLLLTTGCLCCAAHGDLPAAIDALLKRRHEGAVSFDRIFVETTGLADAGPSLNALVSTRSTSGAVSLRGVLTVVSAIQGDEVLDRHDEARRQVAVADRIAVTYRDLVAGDPQAEDASAGLLARLSRLNPTAAIDDARELAANPAALFAMVRPFESVRSASNAASPPRRGCPNPIAGVGSRTGRCGTAPRLHRGSAGSTRRCPATPQRARGIEP